MKKKEILLFATSLVVALAIAEAGIRLYAAKTRLKYTGLSQWVAENFYFHHRDPSAKRSEFDAFDPLLGWRAGPVPGESSRFVTINRQGWRSPFSYKEKKEKKRIILIGDSFTFGLGLKDVETISQQLGKLLGPNYEVFSMAARGYGIDQMAVVATELAPKYDPDYVIIGFIADDLRRSCTSFAWGQARKPTYRPIGKDKVVLTGVPIPPPGELLKRHKLVSQRVNDAVLATMGKSSVIKLIMEPIVASFEKKCIEDLNPRILAHVQNKLKGKTGLSFFHLDGELPGAFVRRSQDLGVKILSMPVAETKMAKFLKVTPGRNDSYHPDAVRAFVYANVYAQLTRERIVRER